MMKVTMTAVIIIKKTAFSILIALSAISTINAMSSTELPLTPQSIEKPKDGNQNGLELKAKKDSNGEWGFVDKTGKFIQSGQGTITLAHGGKYVGEFKNSKANGQGTMTWLEGGEFVGMWKDDEPSGQGTMTWANGNKFVGEWKYGLRIGHGTMTWANGNIYIGEWKDDNPNGQGTMTWANGDKFVGEWKDGKQITGQGTIDMSKQLEEWEKNKQDREDL